MRTILLSGAILALGAFAASAGTTPPAKSEHPGEVALIQEGNNWAYKHFPTNLRLYIYDKDQPGKSLCNNDCSYAWPPVIAHEDAKPMGDWTIVRRDDGRSQWAYKGRPVYVRFHDSPETPTGDGVDGAWHFLEP